MANKSAKKRGVRKLTKLGKKSIAVTIPIETIKKLGWKERQKVKVKKIRGGVSVKDWKK